MHSSHLEEQDTLCIGMPKLEVTVMVAEWHLRMHTAATQSSQPSSTCAESTAYMLTEVEGETEGSSIWNW